MWPGNEASVLYGSVYITINQLKDWFLSIGTTGWGGGGKGLHSGGRSQANAAFLLHLKVSAVSVCVSIHACV